MMTDFQQHLQSTTESGPAPDSSVYILARLGSQAAYSTKTVLREEVATYPPGDLTARARTTESKPQGEEEEGDQQEDEASKQGMSHRPTEGWLEYDHPLRLLMKDLEGMVNRLQQIKHTLESEVEHDSALVKDLAFSFRKLSENLHKFERRFNKLSGSKNRELKQKTKDLFNQAKQLHSDLKKRPELNGTQEEIRSFLPNRKQQAAAYSPSFALFGPAPNPSPSEPQASHNRPAMKMG